MTAVQGFRHDVFVSYAHDDNLPVAGASQGFVSQLVADLRAEIGRKVGKALDIWWDHYSLARNKPVTPEIMAAAGDCATIIVVASPAYLRSEWCSRERAAFGQQRGGGSRAVFIVSLEPLQQDRLPLDLRDYRGYEFYRALDDGRTTRPLRIDFNSDKEPYYNRLSQLVQHVADHLEALLSKPHADSPRPKSVSPAANGSQPSVLLMEVTDDLVQRRAELKDYLEQLGVTVLPERRYSRDDMALHRQQIAADLARSRACVQILGPLAGDRSDHRRGMTWLRYESVRDSDAPTPFLQWRDPDLDVAQIADEDARELIARASVRTDRFPDFRRAIGDLAMKPPRVEPPKQESVLSVFVNSDLADRELRTSVAQWLEANGLIVLEPPQSTIDAREEWETNLRYCDSVLFVYGHTKPGWVRTQILLSNKVRRESPMKLLGVCVGPPRVDAAQDKIADLALRYSGIHYIRNEDSEQPNPLELQRFVDRLRTQ